MRIAFLGAVEFSRTCLEAILASGAHVVGILTKAPGAATMHSDFADLSPVVGTRGIPVHHIRNINDAESLRLLKGMAPDLLFVFGWSQIIGEEVRAIPRGGVIGAHPALLPRNRGRHPIVWALVEGLRSTGLTFFTSTAAWTPVTSSGRANVILPMRMTPGLSTARLSRLP